MTSELDLEQRLDILGILSKAVIDQENQEIAKAMSRFKSDNVQWVLSMLFYTFEQLQNSLDFELYQLDDFIQRDAQN